MFFIDIFYKYLLKILNTALQLINCCCYHMQASVRRGSNNHALAGHRDQLIDLKSAGSSSQEAFFVKIKMVSLRTDAIGFQGIKTDQIDNIVFPCYLYYLYIFCLW